MSDLHERAERMAAMTANPRNAVERGCNEIICDLLDQIEKMGVAHTLCTQERQSAADEIERLTARIDELTDEGAYAAALERERELRSEALEAVERLTAALADSRSAYDRLLGERFETLLQRTAERDVARIYAANWRNVRLDRVPEIDLFPWEQATERGDG